MTGEHIDVFSHAVIDHTRCVTKSVLMTLDILPNVHSVVHNVFKIIQKKADCAVSALAVLPTIPDLAEAWELRIKYA